MAIKCVPGVLEHYQESWSFLSAGHVPEGRVIVGDRRGEKGGEGMGGGEKQAGRLRTGGTGSCGTHQTLSFPTAPSLSPL